MNAKIETLNIKDLVADPDQPRQEFDPHDLARLEKSITRQGVLVPLAVEKNGDKYIIVDGERRFRAATAVGLKELPVIVYDKMDEQTRLITRFHLQEQHSLWTPIDKARVLSQMIRDTGMSQYELADLIGMNQSTVNGYLALLDLNKKTVAIANKEKIPHTYLRIIAGLSKRVDNVKQRGLLEQALLQKVTGKVVLSALDMNKYGIAMTKNLDKIAKAIISEKDLTPTQAIAMTDAQAEMTLKKITVNVGWLKYSLQKGIEDGAPKLITEQDERALMGLSEKLQEFVNKAGYVIPAESKMREKVVR